MAVRAKFRVADVTAGLYQRSKKTGEKDEHGRDKFESETVELRTIRLTPVYGDAPESENKRFWDTSPQGELKLGTVNPEAWQQFELGKAYYIDFTEAPD